MRKKKKSQSARRKSTIGFNPLDQLEAVPNKKSKKARFKDESPQSEIKQVLLKRHHPKDGALSRWFKSIFG